MMLEYGYLVFARERGDAIWMPYYIYSWDFVLYYLLSGIYVWLMVNWPCTPDFLASEFSPVPTAQWALHTSLVRVSEWG